MRAPDPIYRLLRLPAMAEAIRFLARGFVAIREAQPRVGSQFAHQQRWLMTHAALALYFRSLATPEPGFTRLELLKVVQEYGVVSRNTAEAYFAQALKYGLIVPAGGGRPSRHGRTLLSAQAIEMIGYWHRLHLGALDRLDGGSRTGVFDADPIAAMTILEPAVADALITTDPENVLGGGVSFTWSSEGGILMDRLMAGVEAAAWLTTEPALTNVTSIAALARSIDLSASQTARKLAAAEAAGELGWSGRRGRSPMWVSPELRADYARSHTFKLVVVDGAFTAYSLAIARKRLSA